MKILVTGGIGRIGRFTVSHLMAQGHNVCILDRVAESDIHPDVLTCIHTAEYHQVDITDYDVMRPYFDGNEAVVHLAAIPYPVPGRDAEIFDINCGGAFHVYQAAADAGIQRVVSASSINALGNGFGVRPIDIQYFPIERNTPRGPVMSILSPSKLLKRRLLISGGVQGFRKYVCAFRGFTTLHGFPRMSQAHISRASGRSIKPY